MQPKLFRMRKVMFITICVIAYNEEQTLPAILKDIAAQDYAHGSMEVVLVDSASSDHTKKIMQEFAAQNTTQPDMGFVSVSVLDNPKRTLPCGWNVALKAYRGEAILKVDAHASIPKDFVTKNVAVLESGEDVCGGQRPNIIEQPTPFRNTLLLAESSMFGSSIAPYRNNPGKSYVKSMFHAAYRRKVFESIGGFDERMTRNQDNELNFRIRKNGGKIYLNHNIRVQYYCRDTMRGIMKMGYMNGKWNVITMTLVPGSMGVRHFVPLAFVLSTILLVLLTLLTKSMLFGGLLALEWGAYLLLDFFYSYTIAKEKGWKFLPVEIILYPAFHFAYGFGSLCGIAALPKFVRAEKEKKKAGDGR